MSLGKAGNEENLECGLLYNPAFLFGPRIRRIVRQRGLSTIISSIDIPQHKGEKIWTAGILFTGKEVATRKQEPMIFVSFEDEQSVFQTVLSSGAFVRFSAG